MANADSSHKEPGGSPNFFSRLHFLSDSLFIICIPFLFPLMAFTWPLLAALKSKDFKYIRHYPRYFKGGLGYFLETIKRKVFWKRTISIWKRHTLSKEYVEGRLAKRKGKCLRCAKCCKILKCPLLEWDEKEKGWSCAAYGYPFWNGVHCSRYPLTKEEIDEYGCPGFWFDE
jgi:hypothetical protein